MVKKFGLTMLLVMLGMFLAVRSAMALPFDSEGWVNPNYNNSWDVDDATGIARYYFYWENPAVSVTEVDLQFEGDIFNLSVLDATDFTVIAPPSWTVSMYVEENDATLHWAVSDGTGINYTQDPIIVDVDYTLLSSNRYYYGSSSYAGESDSWQWNEAQGANTPWTQKYLMSGSGSIRSYSSGGSTAPVPEPVTLLLFGSGLIGLGFVARRRFLRR